MREELVERKPSRQRDVTVAACVAGRVYRADGHVVPERFEQPAHPRLVATGQRHDSCREGQRFSHERGTLGCCGHPTHCRKRGRWQRSGTTRRRTAGRSRSRSTGHRAPAPRRSGPRPATGPPCSGLRSPRGRTRAPSRRRGRRSARGPGSCAAGSPSPWLTMRSRQSQQHELGLKNRATSAATCRHRPKHRRGRAWCP